MSKSLYLINPAADHPTYFSAEIYAAHGFQPATLIADLAIPTVAALAPVDFEVVLCDENIAPVDFDTPCDFVGITGKITQHGRMVSIAGEFRRRGKVVLIGGPYASLSPENLRQHCDILVLGEIENIANELFSDLKHSTWKEEYRGDKPAALTTPVPKWSAYPNHRALFATIQTSRGCPFECEFCDVIQYLGRSQRHKPVAGVLAELEEVQRYNYRTVFLADDNFTVNRSRSKELLAALKHWNSQQENRISFLTQLSIDAARDIELLRMCAEAGLRHVFIGIETPNEDSLKETKKRQNVGINLSNQICQFLEQGIAVTAGMIVGFDSDNVDMFERQYEFAMGLPVPVFSLGALVAPAATPLHHRMEKENRLIRDGCEVAAAPWDTNIIPKRMSRAELLYGVRWLCNRLYRPDAFGERMSRLIGQFSARNDHTDSHASLRLQALRKIELESLSLLGRASSLGPEVEQMFSRIRKEVSQKPHTAQWAIGMLAQYVQIRYMYDRAGVWNPRMGSAAVPEWEEAGAAEPNLRHFANVSEVPLNGSPRIRLEPV
jgi:radical SAM superfamily enzyme YgiQ (UPF0313 family)